MPVIDEEGRLFGTVNVVDALVILLVLAVGVAGVALVAGSGTFGDDGPTAENETRYVTLDFGSQPSYVVNSIEEGDTAELDERFGNLTITHPYFAPSDNSARTIARVAVRGRSTEDRFTYAGAPLRFGRTLDFETAQYNVSGVIRDIGGGQDLSTGRTPVVLRGTVPSAVADRFDAGDEIRIGGRTSALVEDVALFDTDDPDRTAVFLVANLSTYRSDDAVRYGDTRVQPGQSIALPLDGFRFSGEIERLGNSLDPEQGSVLVSSVVPTDTAQSMSEGDAYRVAGEPVATIESLHVYGTNDPNRKRVFAGLSLRTLRYGDQPRFGQISLQPGATVPFRTNGYSIEGTVERLGALEQRGTERTKTVTLRMRGVPPERADDVRAGMTETTGNRTVARLTEVNSEPATVVLRSDSGQIFARDHPVNQDLTIRAEFGARETTTGTTFKGQRLQVGRTVVLDLGTTTVQATVVSVDE